MVGFCQEEPLKRLIRIGAKHVDTKYDTEVHWGTSLLASIDKSLPQKPSMEYIWNLESIGINVSLTESDNTVAMNTFNDTLIYENGRYTLTWPWKNDKQCLPENRALALGRLKSLVRRLKDNPELIKNYDAIIEDQLKRGIIERVTSGSRGTLKHYIPHHAVVDPTKATTKVRIVNVLQLRPNQRIKV